MKRLLFLAPIVLCGILTAFAEQIKVPDIALVQGGSATVEILLSNERTNLVAFQMDLTLPEGIGIDKTGCKLSSRITDMGQDLVIGKLESGAFRLTSTSMSLTPINGTEGTLLILKLYSEENFVNGQAVISNIYFATSESERIMADDVSFTINTKYKLLQGDVNGDGAVDIADVVAVYNIMAGNNSNGYNGDVNAVGATDIADVVAIYNIMAGGK